MGAVPAGGNVWKTILIGVVTTVAAYIIVNLIFSNKGKKESFKRKKEATVTAWKAMTRSNEFYLDDYYTALCEQDNRTVVKKLQKAIDKQLSDYELLQRKPDIDDDLGLYMNSYIERGKELKMIIVELYESINKVENDPILSEPEKQNRLQGLSTIYMPKISGLLAQDSNRISMLRQDLVDRYGEGIKLFQRKPADEKSIQGKWREGNQVFYDFKADNTMSLSMTGNKSEGNWSIKDNIITIQFKDNSSVDFNITFYGPGYIMFKANNTGVDRVLCMQ